MRVSIDFTGKQCKNNLKLQLLGFLLKFGQIWPEIVWPNEKKIFGQEGSKFGQKTEIWPKNGQIGNTVAQVRSMLDLVTMQMKVELRSRGGHERTREELGRKLYDFPRSYDHNEDGREEEEQEVEVEVELRRR